MNVFSPHRFASPALDDAWVPSSCSLCYGTCSILAHRVDGVVVKIEGNPDIDHVSTSYAERQNLNIRMGNRRYTRLTNAFSKKADMLAYSIAITFMYHNFVRVHQSLRMTPAMKAGVTRHKWSLEEVVELLPEVVAGKRGPYKKRRKLISD